ncbi:MAG: selenide, water dikinase SelD, partial [Candidatus Hydrogenedentota bacterium]
GGRSDAQPGSQVGGGHAHVEVLRQFEMRPDPRVNFTLVSPDSLAPYSGMLPGHIAGHYSYYDSHLDLRAIARYAGCRFFHDEAVGIDLQAKTVICAERPPVPFDFLSINVGSIPVMDNVPGAREYALPAKPVDRFLEGWREIAGRVQEAAGRFRIVVVGAGVGGIELTLSMQHFLQSLLDRKGIHSDGLEFLILDKSSDITPTHNPGVRRRLRRVLERRGVNLALREEVARVSKGGLECTSGEVFHYDALIWTTHAAPREWIREAGFATNDGGFLAVNEFLQSVSHEFVLGAGDCVSMGGSPRPKSGVFAVRQGPYLADNIRRAVRGEALQPFAPQKRFLSLIGTGDENAIASRGPFSWEGPRVWKWKRRIDTEWMAKYRNLRQMSSTTPMRSEVMACGGCGCKAGPAVLRGVFERLRVEHGPDVVIGLDSPDDAAITRPEPGQLTVHTVDFFRAFVDDPYLLGRITALHAMNDVYAMGGSPRHALAQVMLAESDASRAETVLFDFLAGGVATLKEHGAVLIGGHTTEGMEMTVGFTITGSVREDAIISKSGARPGDRLVLTKPLGTGIILAAAMRGEARGDWEDAAIAAMLTSNAAAARILADHGATACTDVSGFGLAGHLLEILEASNVGAELNPELLPALPGALEAAQAGVRSTMFPKNESAAANIDGAETIRGRPQYDLLFDPQTSGGLIAKLIFDVEQIAG